MMSLLATVALTLGTAIAAPSEWQADYGKALAETRSNDRALLVVLDDSTKTEAQVADELLKASGENAELLAAYELCHVDVSTDYGKKVAERFGATELPHTTIIDKTGEVILYKNRGDIAKHQWKNALSTYKNGLRLVSTPQPHTTRFRGATSNSSPAVSTPAASFTPSYQMSTPAVSSPGYCPSCQRNGGF
ncbi:TlpA family protein disulfide reductase [Adhaeretor mobilis]|uniref:Uncharacterized protein n=1 Tax=Adhaeretor mobilis TaxID=1930276 RepID=A0A517MSV2_9BACT|nr:hypothetical protein [Adhaeretor mobilis]QDS97970.1 hypothetical protein HG15A2_12400 [Adhaeretor mobilis]